MNSETTKNEKRIVMSGMRPTAGLHLGNWMGALSNWVELQEKYPCYFSIVDWHALTTDFRIIAHGQPFTFTVEFPCPFE